MTEKPAEIKVELNGPRSRAPAAKAGFPGGQMLAYSGYPPPMPYGYPYPSPFGPPLPLMHQLPTGVHMGGVTVSTEADESDFDYPSIAEWLNHCDRHPKRSSYKLGRYADVFEKEGFMSLDQLIGPRITIENLAGWLSLGKGTTDLIIRYAEQDVLLVKNRKFQLFSQAT